LVAVGCAEDGDDGGGEGVDGTVTVFAAASLTDAFDDITTAFEEAYPEASVEPSYAGSSDLARQIEEGAPADVFASADTINMDRVVESGDVTASPAEFAQNVLEIAVPAGNPGQVEGLDDFARDELLVGLCAEEVPCGRFGREVLANAGITPAQDTDEPDVRALLTKLEAGDLDVGLVYRSDVQAAGETVEGIEIPDDDNVVATYPIAPVATSGNPDASQAFLDFVLSEEGQRILVDHGFLPAP
jgi:molybdate transport system substrate-binding protein